MTHGELTETWWQRVRRSFRTTLVDAALAIGYVALVGGLVYFVGVTGTGRAVLGLPLVLFLPGYVLVAALFPATPGRRSRTGGSGLTQLLRTGSPGWYERLALSFALSLALLPLFGLVLATTPWGFTPASVLVTLGGFIVLGALIASVRRLRLPRDRRYEIPTREASADLYRGLFGQESGVDAVLNGVLLVSVVIALGVFGYALVAPPDAAGSSEFQILTESDSGELVASGYPDELAAGDSAELTAAITNNEGEETTYTVVVEVHRVDPEGEELTVLERSELTRMEATVADGETAHLDHTVSPAMTGENLRLNYYLYQGDAPDEADAESADEHLWINVDGT